MSAQRTFSFTQSYMIVMSMLIIAFISMATITKYHNYKRELQSAVHQVERDLGSRSKNAKLALAAMKDRNCTNLEQLQAKQDLDEADKFARKATEMMGDGGIASSLDWTAMATRRYELVSVERCAARLDGGR